MGGVFRVPRRTAWPSGKAHSTRDPEQVIDPGDAGRKPARFENPSAASHGALGSQRNHDAFAVMKTVLWIIVGLLVGVGLFLGLLVWAARNRRTGADGPKKPMDSQAAARRLLCLGALGLRLELETQARLPTKKRPKTNRKVWDLEHGRTSLNQWLKQEGLWDRLSNGEKKLLNAPLGAWDEEAVIDVSWQDEAIEVIGWALRKADDVLRYDDEVDGEKSPLNLPLFEATSGFIACAALRPLVEITHARDLAELWLWRANAHQMQQQPNEYPPPPGSTYEKLIAETAEAAERAGFLKRIGGDFPAFGKPYARVTTEEQATLTSIATERLHGLNWLCGHAEDWDERPPDP